MKFEDLSKLSLEDLIHTSIRPKRNDPIFSPQHKKIFIKSQEKPETFIQNFKIKGQERLLLKKTLPSNHRIESNFSPYLKANKQIQRFTSRKKLCNTFDLVEQELKVFKDPHVSIDRALKSQSKIRFSRLPLFTPVNKSAEKVDLEMKNRCRTAASCSRSIKSIKFVMRQGLLKRSPKLNRSLKITRVFN
jgi:hypothetical protein